MLRGPHTSASSVERKITKHLKTAPFVLSYVIGVRDFFSSLLNVNRPVARYAQ